MSIKIDRVGIIHYHARCDECDFDAAIQTEETPTRADVRRSVMKHVRKTAHTVVIESGSATRYIFEKDNRRRI
jgi:hypothetical protein